MKKIINNNFFYLLIIAAGSIFFSFFRIAKQSLWNDEAISIVWAASKSLVWIWENVPKTDLHPPLYYSVLHFWQMVFGDSVLSIRGLSAVFFILSSLLVFILAKKMFLNRKTALLTAFIFITNPFAVLYAQEVRSYSMLIFFILINTLFFYKIVYEKNQKSTNYIVYFLTALVFIYTNILSLFLLLTHFIILLGKRNKRIVFKFIGVYGLLFLSYLPVLHIIQSANEFDYSYYYTERFNIALKAIVAIAGFIGARINVLNGKWGMYGLLGASLAFYGVLFGWLVVNFKKVNKFLLSYFLLSFGFILVAAHIKFPVPDPKYFYIAFPAFILLIGNLFYILQNKKYFLYLLFIILLGFNFTFLYYYHFDKTYEKENWQSVVKMVEGDYLSLSGLSGVVISPVSAPHSTWDYYATGILPAFGALQNGAEAENINKTLDEYNIVDRDIVYLSRFIWELYDPEDNIRIYLENKAFVKTQEFKDTKVEYWKYVKK